MGRVGGRAPMNLLRRDPTTDVTSIFRPITVVDVIRGAACWWILMALIAALCLSATPAGGAAGASDNPPVTGTPTVSDTTGAAIVQWAYDSWTVPWVEVRGAPEMLTPSSNATLVALTCATAELERERLVRHLNPEECEHRMAGIRADQDTALTVQVDLEVVESPTSGALVRLEPEVTLRLEDDRGGSWGPVSVKRGPVLSAAKGLKLQRDYQPPWMRGSEHFYSHRYGVSGGEGVTLGKHRVRFARRDPETGQPLLRSETRWVRLRLSYGGHEWVATWPFRPEEASGR